MLGTSDNNFGPSLDYMLEAGVLTCARDMRNPLDDFAYIAIANSQGLCPASEGASYKRLTNVAYFQFATEPVWSQNPGSQTTKQIHPATTSSVPPRH
jgi:hypothetical protein